MIFACRASLLLGTLALIHCPFEKENRGYESTEMDQPIPKAPPEMAGLGVRILQMERLTNSGDGTDWMTEEVGWKDLGTALVEGGLRIVTLDEDVELEVLYTYGREEPQLVARAPGSSAARLGSGVPPPELESCLAQGSGPGCVARVRVHPDDDCYFHDTNSLFHSPPCMFRRLARELIRSRDVRDFAARRTAKEKPAWMTTGSLAVLELDNKLSAASRASVDAAYLTDQIRAEVLHQRRGLQVMTRENLLVLLEKAGKELAKCEGTCEVDTGRRVGADLVISGTLAESGGKLRLELSLHETHAGKRLASKVAEAAQAADLDGALLVAMPDLLAPLR